MTNDGGLLDHRRPFYARELAPRRGRDAGAKRRNPEYLFGPQGQLPTVAPPSSNTPIFEDEQAILTVPSSYKPILEDEKVVTGPSRTNPDGLGETTADALLRMCCILAQAGRIFAFAENTPNTYDND